MKKVILFSLFIIHYSIIHSQNVGIGTTLPKASAAFDINSNNKGILIPRTNSSSRTRIAEPAKGLLLYDTTVSIFNYYDGGKWRLIHEQR